MKQILFLSPVVMLIFSTKLYFIKNKKFGYDPLYISLGSSLLLCEGN